MQTGPLGRITLRLATLLVLAFMYIPLSLVIAYAFNESGTSAWPPSGFTLRWVALR
jgi:putative spermidine/putrescine transport system permease protein